MIQAKPSATPGEYVDYKFPTVTEDSPAKEFNQLARGAENNFVALIKNVKANGGSNALERRGQNNQQVILRKIFNNEFSPFLNIFALDRKKVSDENFQLIKKEFYDLNELFNKLYKFYKSNRPIELINYSHALFAFVTDFIAKENISINQIIFVLKKDLTAHQTNDLALTQYLKSQFSYAFAVNAIVQSVNFTVK